MIPDEITEFYIKRMGFNSPDPRLIKLISLAAQKFLSDVTYDTSKYFDKNNSSKSGKEKNDTTKYGGKEKKRVLQTEDLQNALRDYGINARKPDYFADTTQSGVTRKK